MKHRYAKWAALIYSALLVMVYIIIGNDTGLALGNDGRWWQHLTFHHIHASVFHLLCNLWAFLWIVFYLNPSAARLVLAFVLASTFPSELVGDLPIMGLSGIIYCLLGLSIQPTLRGIIRYNGIILLVILGGLLVPSVSVSIHLYCYLMGLVVAVTKN